MFDIACEITCRRHSTHTVVGLEVISSSDRNANYFTRTVKFDV